MKKIIAILLAALMCVGLLTACGDDNSPKPGGIIRTFPGGTTHTWGEITAYVPVDMTMYSGDGFADPENPKMVSMYDNTDKEKYILIQIVDSEKTALSMIEKERKDNKRFNPMNAAFNAELNQWKGIVFDAGEYHHLVFSTTLTNKVYFIKSSGYRFAEDGNIPHVLNSLR